MDCTLPCGTFAARASILRARRAGRRRTPRPPARILPREEVRLDALVLEPVEQLAARRLAVAPCRARLLVVALERVGKLPVHDAAHVRLVDAHAEGLRRHHHAHVATHEALERVDALRERALRVEAPDVRPGGVELIEDDVCRLHRRGVDDDRARAPQLSTDRIRSSPRRAASWDRSRRFRRARGGRGPRSRRRSPRRRGCPRGSRRWW